MRVVFAGTPGFAVPSLRAVAAAHEVPLVLSQPDRPKGRGLVLEATPVKAAAAALGIKVLQPEKIGEAADAIAAAAPDVLVTAAFGQKVPDRVLGLAKHGGLNVHASLLPRHRGASPIAHAILAGDAESGVTIFRMVKEMDAGPVLVKAALQVPPDATTEALEALIAAAAAPALLEALKRLESGSARFEEQDHSKATLAPKLAREDGKLDFARPAAELARRVRAMTPWPGAAAVFERAGKTMKVAILAAAAAPGEFPGAPGDVIEVRKGAVRVKTGEGALDLLRLQPESRKPVSADEFANGFRLREGPSKFA